MRGSGRKVKPGVPGGTPKEDLQEVMIGMAQQTTIKTLHQQGFGPSAIAARLGVDRKTVRKYLTQDDFSPPPPPLRPPGPSKLDPYHGVIQQWLAEDTRTFHKQHHTAQRILERLQAECPDFEGSYSLVQRYVKSLRTPAPTTGTLELVWHPGECQVDFGTAEAVLDGVPQTCKYLTVSFPYSNAGYLQLFGGETAECLITGLQVVFERLGGVPPPAHLRQRVGGGPEGRRRGPPDRAVPAVSGPLRLRGDPLQPVQRLRERPCGEQGRLFPPPVPGASARGRRFPRLQSAGVAAV